MSFSDSSSVVISTVTTSRFRCLLLCLRSMAAGMVVPTTHSQNRFGVTELLRGMLGT